MNLPKHCDRCGTEINLTVDMPRTPHIIYFSGNNGASGEVVYLCSACRKGFVDWFISYSLEED